MLASHTEDSPLDMFCPPINRSMRALDRSFFKKTVLLAAAYVLEKQDISRCRLYLGADLLHMDRLTNVRTDPTNNAHPNDRKCLLLRPGIKPNDGSTWTDKIVELVERNQVAIAPFRLDLTYDHWTYHDIMSAIIPQEEQDELPTGFSIVGHVAHLNLREQYFPYKHLIAAVLLDKNPIVKTVINKIDIVGTQNEYRTFDYELLAGDPNMKVEVKEEDCLFRFDYSKVYWNSRLNTEHRRLIDVFQPGEAVCDVMAGVGPFAIPAGKKGTFVWANDLNPDSYASLQDAISVNKVSNFVRPFNEDGRTFILSSAKELMRSDVSVQVKQKKKKIRRGSRSADSTRKGADPPIQSLVVQPKTFNHYVMNLPATAMTFLNAFIGLYRGHEALFHPFTSRQLPMIHVYCFSTKSDDNKDEAIKICKEISDQINHAVAPGDHEVTIWNVRDVAPQKRMFCASFRLPPAVAFGYSTEH